MLIKEKEIKDLPTPLLTFLSHLRSYLPRRNHPPDQIIKIMIMVEEEN